jgi:hypothetical protein
MSTYAVIENGVVVNMVVGEDKDTVESVVGLPCVEYVFDPQILNSAPNIGDLWDGSVFVKPNLS